MVQGLTITRLPVPLLLTATNSSRCGAQQREVQALSAAELRLLQLIPSGEVITRLPLPLSLMPTTSRARC
jgi:hypothetical protein